MTSSVCSRSRRLPPAAATRALTLAALAAALLWSTPAAAAEVLLQVIAQEAPLHTGPGVAYREVYQAKRGEIFPVRERATVGYWFRVELDDGTSGWIQGDSVVPIDPSPPPPPGFFGRLWRGFAGAVLGPPAIRGSDVEVSFSAGVLGEEGMYVLRPAWLIDDYFALEGFAGLNARAQEDVFLAGVGWTLRMLPGARLGPYVNAGVGMAYFRPKVDNFTDGTETRMALSAGGGFELTFKKQITVRLDFRNWTLFDPDKASNAQEYTSGLAIFF
ncbi:SH3 domain-containing protein [Haliangium sp.]|uniref:SH3 domain-containing protein n=1 Tax=Haliangium sp. TaxID=2663208 RepID=UPI003D0A7999